MALVCKYYRQTKDATLQTKTLNRLYTLQIAQLKAHIIAKNEFQSLCIELARSLLMASAIALGQNCSDNLECLNLSLQLLKQLAGSV
jgi:hypothetical protein